MSSKYVLTLSVLSLLVMGETVTARAADSCQAVFEAMTKIVTIPSHSYTTHTGGPTKGQPAESETIYVGGKA